MPYPVLPPPPPPPPLVEIVPSELRTTENEPSAQPNVQANAQPSSQNFVQSGSDFVQSGSADDGSRVGAGAGSPSSLLVPSTAAPLPSGIDAPGNGSEAFNTSTETLIPATTEGAWSPSTLAIANSTTPEIVIVEFSGSDAGLSPSDLGDLGDRVVVGHPAAVAIISREADSESVSLNSTPLRSSHQNSNHQNSNHQNSNHLDLIRRHPVDTVDTTEDAASGAALDILLEPTGAARSPLQRSVASSTASRQSLPLGALSLRDSGIPPLDVDRLLSEGLESFRARIIPLATARQPQAEAPSDTTTTAAALGGRVSIRNPSHTPHRVISESASEAASASGSAEGAIALPSAAAPRPQPRAAVPHSPSEADAAALEEAANAYYDALKQDLDFASAQLIEPLGETFSALYDIAQEAADDAVPDDAFPNVPAPDASGDGDLDGEAVPTLDAPDSLDVPEREAPAGEAPAVDDGRLLIPVEPPATSPESPLDSDRDVETDTGIDEILEPDADLEGDPILVIPAETSDPSEAGDRPLGSDDNPLQQPDDGSLLSPPTSDTGASGAPINVAPGDALELTSDRQTYDTNRRVFIAEGNVELLVRGVVLNADRVQVNLPNKIAVAQGNVILTRGEQVLRGDRIEYNLVREEGVVSEARGEIFIPQISADTEVTRTDSGRVEEPPLSDQISGEQPPVETATTTGSLTIGIGSGSGGVESGAAAGDVRQLRFEADTIDFTSDGWEATNVRITNDPFSPPELEIRTERATFRRLSPTRSELIASNPRLVFDQGFSLPLFRRRFVFDENRRDQGIVQFGFDREDRGGLYIERTFEPLVTPFATLSVRPQYFIQRALGGDTDDETASPDQDDNDGGLFDPDSFGLIASLDVDIDTRTSFEGRLEMTSLDLEDFDDEGRGSVRLQRGVLPILHRGSRLPSYHTLTAEYSYRDRLFNGTLGFQTVQRTYGLVLTSPTIQLTGEPGSQGLELSYQAAIQRINANVDVDRRDDLLPPPPRDNVRTTLTRYQIAAQLRRFYFLWVGTPLPATPDEGLKYTPAPVVPYIAVVPRVQGIASLYSSGDTQPILTGELALVGQFGNFSRPFADYLGFNITYRQSTEGSESPFTFDREDDRQVVSGGLTFQIYGPLRAGFRTSISLNQDEEFDNSFFLEYSRRTYGIVLRYSPDRETGSLTFRLSDFTWTGTPEPFGGSAFEDDEVDIGERDEPIVPNVPTPRSE